MKYFIYTILSLGIILLIFNILQIDFKNTFGQESTVAWIGVLSSLCVIVLMWILLVSRTIQKKYRK